MFDLPGEPETAQEAARRLYAAHPPYRIQTYWTNLLPGTEMVDHVLAAGLVTREQVDRLEEGHDFDFFRESNLGRDPRRMRLYKSYETLFKLMPVLPARWRSRLGAGSFSRLPSAACSLLSFAVDAGYGLFSRNPHHVAYARHYLHHLRRFAGRRLGLAGGPATRPRIAAGPAPTLSAPAGSAARPPPRPRSARPSRRARGRAPG
jgi:hypothetical protein